MKELFSESALEAPASRFTMRLEVALQVNEEWMRRSEAHSGVASEAVREVWGGDWLAPDPALGEVQVLDGSLGRGAAGWIPVVEWVGMQAAGGLIGLAAGQTALAGLRRIRKKLEESRSQKKRALVSRGLASFIAMEHVFKTTSEAGLLNVEFAQEPSVLGGRPPSETSFTGLEPWIISLVNGSRKIRYVLVVSPEGEVEGCIEAPAGEFDPVYGLLPPVE